jgi:hypothetical protein
VISRQRQDHGPAIDASPADLAAAAGSLAALT